MPKPSSVLRRWSAVLRVQAYLTVVTLSVLSVLAGRAYSSGRKAILMLGERLAGQLPHVEGGEAEVRVNGEEVFFSSGYTALEVAAFLDAVERYCSAGAGDMRDAFGALLQSPEVRTASSRLPAPDRWLTVRQDVGQGAQARGEVACVTQPARAPHRGIAARIADFAQTGDLGALGALRFFRAERTPGSARTHVIGIWSDARLNMQQMFPEHGDAPGRDPVSAPRPPAAVRRFSGEVLAGGKGAFTYESSAEPAAILNHYDQEMTKRQWTKVTVDGTDKGSTRVEPASAYVHAGRALVVAANRALGGGTDVVVLELGAGQPLPNANSEGK